MFFLAAVCAGIFVLLAVHVYFRYNYAGRKMSKIPGPKGYPLIGNMIDLLLPTDALFLYLRNLPKTYPNICRLGSVHIRAVLIFNPKDVETILSTTKFNDKQHPYTFFKPWMGEGLLISNGEKWHQRRKLLTPAFHFNILKQFTATFNEQTQVFLDRVQQEVGKHHTDVAPLVSRHTLRIMCETSMGSSMSEDIKSVANKYFNAIHQLGYCLVLRTTRVFLYLDSIFRFTTLKKNQDSAIKDLHTFTNQIIKERRIFRQTHEINMRTEEDEVLGRKSRLAMLDLLLEAEKEGKINQEGIREEVDTFMFEGHDTTASTLLFMIMRIANEPHIQKKIQEEMDRIFGSSDRLPKMDDLNEMKYLELCIKESMRLYPVVALITRCNSEDVVLSGYTVPAGTMCQIQIFDVHRNRDLYPEPEKFIPERFLPENCSKRHPFAYIPFSAGPRNCIGQKFAMLEMKTVMSGLLRRFTLEPVTKAEDLKYSCDIVLRPKDPIYVRFCDRKR